MSKKKILIISAAIIIILFVFGFFYFVFVYKKEEAGNIPRVRTLEEILKTDLTAPLSEIKIPQEIIDKLSVFEKKKIPVVSEEIIKSLTAPAK
jgi:hypothetical protein